MSELCFFCAAEKGEQSLVCSSCGRDVAIPAALMAEHQSLSLKRDRLCAELVEAKARLTAHHQTPAIT
jgi:hypothetical protein